MADEEQVPTVDSFGNTEWPGGVNPFADEAPETSATVAEVEETPEQETVVDVEAPAEVEVTTEPEEPSEEETPEQTEAKEEAERLFAGKYKTPEDLEAAYESSNREASRMAQDRAALQRQVEEQKAFIEKARPIIEKLYQEPQVPQIPEGMEYDPQALQQFIVQRDQQTREQLEAQFKEQQEALQKQQAEQQWLGELSAFRQAFPDSTSVDNEIQRVWTEHKEDLPPNRESLEVAYTLAKNPQAHQIIQRLDVVPNREAVERALEVQADPNLLRYVAANPASFEVDSEAWNDVKMYASLPALLNATQQQGQTAQQQQAETAKERAFLETGSGGQPAQAAPGTRPGEESFMDVVKHWERENQVLGPAPK